MDKYLQDLLIKPLKYWKEVDVETVRKASHRIDEKVLANEILTKLEALVGKLLNDSEVSWQNKDQAQQVISIIQLLHASGRIGRQQYVFLSSYIAESIHSERLLSGLYNSQLAPISAQIEEIESTYMSIQDNEWIDGEEPEEYKFLDTQYNKILEEKLVEVLRELKLAELAELRTIKLNEYEILRERGRRHMFHGDELEAIVEDIAIRYEEDARKAAEAQAYFAAIISLGASMEGIFLLRCLKSKNEAISIAKTLRKAGRDPTKWGFDTLIEVCSNSGWLKPVETSQAVYDSAKLAHLVRNLRNSVHPGRQAIDRPWLEPNEQEYNDAKSIYILIKESLGLKK